MSYQGHILSPKNSFKRTFNETESDDQIFDNLDPFGLSVHTPIRQRTELDFTPTLLDDISSNKNQVPYFFEEGTTKKAENLENITDLSEVQDKDFVQRCLTYDVPYSQASGYTAQVYNQNALSQTQTAESAKKKKRGRK